VRVFGIRARISSGRRVKKLKRPRSGPFEEGRIAVTEGGSVEFFG
jgi:hypothetical protein